MDSYRQRAEEMVEGYKEEIKVQKKKRREQINSRKEEYLARVHARREERQRLLARLSERGGTVDEGRNLHQRLTN